MHALREKIILLQWLSGILAALAVVVMGLYTNHFVEFNPNSWLHQNDIAGTYG